MSYSHRQALIFGAGRSGLAAARLLKSLGTEVTVLDEHWTDEQRATFAADGISCLAWTAPHLPDCPCDLVVTSPSFGLSHPWIQATQAQGIELISELELGGHYWQGEILALTGSKGKSSVIKCLTTALNRAGSLAVTAGNYGIPLCERVMTCDHRGQGTIAVTEVSSFQMEHTPTFAPDWAALLNLQADHLDRHGTMEAYAALKWSLLRPTPRLKAAFVPYTLKHEAPSTASTFGVQEGADWRYGDHAVQHGTEEVPISGYFDNPVLGPASALIVALLQQCGLSNAAICEGFQAFEPLPHRMQRLGQWQGIAFINDSKATSLAATQAALQMVGQKVRLIAGGLLKESELAFLGDTLRQTTLKVYLIGSSQTPLFEAWSPFVPCECCETMACAVAKAASEAYAGETILLSPGTASFDQYSGMAARGDDFRAQFEKLNTAQATN